MNANLWFCLLPATCCLAGCLGDDIAWQSPSAVEVEENTAGVFYQIQASDRQTGDKIVSFNVAGEDADKFVITEGNSLSFAQPPDFEDPQDANQDNVYMLEITQSESSAASTLSLAVSLKDMPISASVARLFPLDGGLVKEGVNGITPVIDVAFCDIELPFGEVSDAIGYDKHWAYGDWPLAERVDNRGRYISPDLAPDFDHEVLAEPYDAECFEGEYFRNDRLFTLPEAFYEGEAEPIDVFTIAGQKFELESRSRSNIASESKDISFDKLQISDSYVAIWNQSSLWLVDRKTTRAHAEVSLARVGRVEGVGASADGSVLLMAASQSESEIRRSVYRFNAEHEYALETVYDQLLIDHGPGYFKHEEITLKEINGEVVVQGINLGACDQTNTYVAHFKVTQYGVDYFAPDMFQCDGDAGDAETQPSLGVENPFLSFGLSANSISGATLLLPMDNALQNIGGRYSFGYHFMEAEYRVNVVMADVGDYYYPFQQFRFSCRYKADCDYPDRIFYLSEEGAIHSIQRKDLWTANQASRVTSSMLTVVNFDLDRNNHLLYAVGYWGAGQVPVYAVIHYLTGAASYLPLSELLSWPQ